VSTKDKHQGKCKECTKESVKKRYRSPEIRREIIAYEKKRSKEPERRKKRKYYRAAGRAKDPEKSRNIQTYDSAIRRGKLIRQPCVKCGNPKSEGHHTDYSKPFLVTWLCRPHHMEAHGKTCYEVTLKKNKI